MILRDRREVIVRVIEKQTLIGGRFSGLRHVGSGAFSLVFEAYDDRLKKRVALKFFCTQDSTNPYRLASFKREAEVIEQFVDQPDILKWIAPLDSFSFQIKTDDFEITEAVPYYAVELASGDAASAIHRGEWSCQQKIERFRAMCRAVRRIHAAGVVHRDIKLSNYLTDGPRTWLSDFGTAKSLVEVADPISPQYQMPVGDLTYAAPELFAAIHDVDASICANGDIYALGALFFEMITGVVLNPHVLDQALTADLVRTMNAVPRNARVRIYHEILPGLEASHPLPLLDDFDVDIPAGVREPVDKLYRGLCAIDYRRRLCNFDRIFSYIRQAEIILRNDAAYRAWRIERDKRRRNAELKQLRRLNRSQKIGVLS
jgi:serine/threonine protein kinase